MTRNKFTREFKIEAVRLLELNKKPSAELARELGIKRNQLYKWKEEIDSFGAVSATLKIENIMAIRWWEALV
jgi:transposase